MLAYFVRHAESLANVESADGLNDGLSELGRRQAEALAQRFRAAGIRAIYSSPFRRAIETALPLSRMSNLKISIRPELCEHHHRPPGTAADIGVPGIARLCNDFPEVQPCADCHKPFVWAPADEAFDDLLRRARAFAAYLKTRWPDPDDVVAVFGHGSPTARMVEAWLADEPGPSFRFVIDNGTISAVRFFEGVSSLVCLNEASHLHGLPVPAGANYSAGGVFRPRPVTVAW